MGRRSKLTSKQWVEIERRVLAGEKIRALSREFEVAESTIRERVSAQVAQIKNVAEQLVSANAALNALPVSAQVSAQSYAQKLQMLSDALGDASIAGALVAKRIAEAALADLSTRQDAEVLSEEVLRTQAQASAVVNGSAKMGMEILGVAAKAGMPTEQPEERDITPDLSKVRAVIAGLKGHAAA